MPRARRKSGSASAGRVVAWRRLAKSVRSIGDFLVVGPEALLVNGQRPAVERLGLGQSVGVVQQYGQPVEVPGDAGMVGPESPLVDGQRPAIERLGLGQPVGVLQHLA